MLEKIPTWPVELDIWVEIDCVFDVVHPLEAEEEIVPKDCVSVAMTEGAEYEFVLEYCELVDVAATDVEEDTVPEDAVSDTVPSLETEEEIVPGDCVSVAIADGAK